MIKYKIPQVKIRLIREGTSLMSYQPFNSPAIVYTAIANELKDYDRETALVVCLDTALHPINFSQIALGGLDQCSIAIPNVFKSAILSNARSIMIAHNHPSGKLDPSIEDLQITKRIAEAGSLLDIPLLDHIICGSNNYYSIRDNYVDLFMEDNN